LFRNGLILIPLMILVRGFFTTFFKQNLVIFHVFLLFYRMKTLWIVEICDTPAEKLASRDPTDACVEEAWQTVGGKGADF
jgi:hypothetical protein